MSGRVVDGRYELLGELGGGAMGQVYRGIDRRLKRPVAVKFLSRAIAENRKARDRFDAEAQALAQLHHPSVAAIYDYGVEDDQPYMIMEFIEGATLDKVLKERPLPPDVAVPILIEMLDGLGHAHSKGIFHRDIKPSNVMLTTAGHAKVIDFGIAHVEDSERRTVAGDILCTPAYASPEQAGTLKTGEKIDGRSDVYSVGTVFFEMLTGRPPIERDSIPATLLAHATEDAPRLPEKFDPAIATAVDRALARERDKRFRTTGEFKTAIESAVPASTLGGNTVAAHLSTLSRSAASPTVMEFASQSEVQRPGSQSHKARKVSWMIYASVGVLVAALGIGLWMLKLVRDSSAPVAPPAVEVKAPPPPKDWDIVPLPKQDAQSPVIPAKAPKTSQTPQTPQPQKSAAMSAEDRAELEKRRTDLEVELKKQSARLATLKSLGESASEQSRLEKLCADLRDQLDSIGKKLSPR